MSDIDNVIDLQAELEKRMKDTQLIEFIFTNDKTNPAPRQLLHVFYDGVLKNRVGIMHAKHKATGHIHTVLVGVQVDGKDVACFPMARVLTKDEQDEYLAPDGNGGYLDGSD